MIVRRSFGNSLSPTPISTPESNCIGGFQNAAMTLIVKKSRKPGNHVLSPLAIRVGIPEPGPLPPFSMHSSPFRVIAIFGNTRWRTVGVALPNYTYGGNVILEVCTRPKGNIIRRKSAEKYGIDRVVLRFHTSSLSDDLRCKSGAKGRDVTGWGSGRKRGAEGKWKNG